MIRLLSKAVVAPIAALLAGSAAAAEAHPTTPDTFQLQPGLEINLFAREPMIVDPVAMCFDEDGRIYVVEMRDYPLGIGPDRKQGGTIRLLLDKDSDGKPDNSVVFAENLSFPTSIVPWKGGVFVSAPPEIIYFKDTDGDGKADVRETWYSGFVRGVTDSNVNGLAWGLDNLIHGANGGNGGNISGSIPKENPIAIQNLDFAFNPSTRRFAPTTQTSGGFGIIFDDWGHSFTTYNINHIQQRIVPLRYLTNATALPALETTRSISDHEEMSRVFPISTPETRVNHPEQSGHFSSAGGMGYVSSFGAISNSTFVCDVVGNLVHRDVLLPNGPIFKASRAQSDQHREFLAARDSAFRPVGLVNGPDGALYLLDMQRDVIEHPDYIPEKVKKRLSLRAGEDRGRIYRITPAGGLPNISPKLSKASDSELVSLLGHTNRWSRQTAQRLLIEREARAVVPELTKAARDNSNPRLQLHALWTLQGLSNLPDELVISALTDRASGIRENGLVLAETRESPGLRDAVLKAITDPEPRVRFQAVLSAGRRKGRDLDARIAEMLAGNLSSSWMRFAALTALSANPPWNALLQIRGMQGANRVLHDWTRELSEMAGASATSKSWSAILVTASSDPDWLGSALEGLSKGIERNVLPDMPALVPELQAVLSAAKTAGQDRLLERVLEFEKRLKIPADGETTAMLKKAADLTKDERLPISTRISKARLLRFAASDMAIDTLLSLLTGIQRSELQRAALSVLKDLNAPRIADGVVKAWPAIDANLRPEMISLLLGRTAYHPVLLTALETEQIRLGELNLDLEQRRTLMRESTPEVHRRAAKLLGDEEYANRKKVVSEWLEKLPARGNAAEGKVAFEKNCAQCHAVGKLGHHVGPELTDLSHRSLEDLLSNILDPNMAINPAFVSYNVELDSGDLETGLLKPSGTDTIVLLQALEKQVTIPRQKVRKIRSSGVSLMPEGFETVLTMQQMRDLLAFLLEPR